MIEVYSWSNTDYSRNGDMALLPDSCVFSMELNGMVEIMLEHGFDPDGRWKYLKNDNLIACPTPYSQKQLFRIYEVKKNSIAGTVTAYARHIYYDLERKVILDKRPTNKNGQDALEDILEGTDFTAHSNIPVINTAYYVRRNVIEAIAGNYENSFLNRWGGEIFPSNFDLYILSRVGQDNGLRVEFGHNLDGIEENVNTEDVVTRCIPVGFDGITLEPPEPWVDSPNIEKYPFIKEKVVRFEQIRFWDGDVDPAEVGGYQWFDTLEEVREALVQAAREFMANGGDQPVVNYKVNMVLLAGTTEYRGYEVLETVNIGDTVRCSHRDIEIEVSARCIRILWDCLTQRPMEIELGNFINTYLDEQESVRSQLSRIASEVDQTYRRGELDGILRNFVTKENLGHYVSLDEMLGAMEGFITPYDLANLFASFRTEVQAILYNDLQFYVTVAELVTTLAPYVTKSALETSLQDYITKEMLEERLKELFPDLFPDEDPDPEPDPDPDLEPDPEP